MSSTRKGAYNQINGEQTPLNITLLSDMFKMNRSIIRPKYVDNKIDRKRDIARQHAKERDDEGDYPKEIKMGEILMPPYLWFNNEESNPGLKGLVGENNNPSTLRNEKQASSPDLRQLGLVGENNNTRATTSNQQRQPLQYNQDNIHSITPDLQPPGLVGKYIHSDLNVLLQSKENKDKRSVLIDEDTISNRRIIISDDFHAKKNVFERLGTS